MNERVLLSAAAPFEAARQVPTLPEGHRGRNLHGHSFIAAVRATPAPAWEQFPGSAVTDLQQQLTRCIARLDYSHLNTLLDVPTDENLARWLLAQLPDLGIQKCAIQSTTEQGVDLDGSGHAHIWRRYQFEAAHQLPNVPAGHKCGRMHGHGFIVILHADANIGDAPMGIDYDHIDACWAPLHARLDHHCLNDIPGLENPTSENLSQWIWAQLKTELPELSWVTVYETGSCGANFDGTHYRIWKDLTLDSAVQLPDAPPRHPLGRLHGHTFTLRLHLHAALDEVMGWTIDFGDVKELFRPVFKTLDHHPLHTLDQLERADTTGLARWIRQQAAPMLPALDRVDLFETRGCGSILSWGEQSPALPI